MAAPVNIDAANAIDLGAFPANVVQDVHDAGLSYTVWYKFTAVTGFNLAGIFGFGDLVGYKPRTNIWVGTPGSLTAWTDETTVTGQNKPVQFPVTVGTAYYLEFVKNGNFATSILTIDALYLTNQVAPAGSIFINDDSPGFGAVLISSTVDYTVLRHLYPFPAGEEGDVLLPAGRYLFTDDFDPSGIVVYLFETDLSLIGLVATPWLPSQVTKIRACQGAGKFYFGCAGSGVTDAQIASVSSTGVVGTVHTIAASMTRFCVKDDETIAYFTGVGGSLNSQIQRWDMVGSVPLSDLVADVGGTYFITDMLYLSDDTIIVCYQSLATFDCFVRRYDALTGATLNTYAMGATSDFAPVRLAYALDTPLSFWIYLHPLGVNLGKSFTQNIRCSDGVVLTNRITVEFEQGLYQHTETATPLARFGNSTSCPLVITGLAIGAPSTGTIVVNKITSPSGSSQVFDFNAGGGLTPTTFGLEDGESQIFSNVPVGVYSIEEIVPVGWSVSYSVSDGSPNTALDLGADEVIIVNVTNTLLSTAASGLYKIVPGKRNDTIFTDVDTGATRDVKIPNPFIKTGVVGE